ncbi:hypothetical protein VTO42DRAFT_8130 [Malbranchea cinnamomea]
MVKVAIAGGSSPTLGRSIVKAILATNGRHTPIILSRRKPRNSGTPDDENFSVVNGQRVETRYVDYHDQGTLVAALRDIHTVISVILIPDSMDFVTTHVNLLHAAREAGVKRFAPSEWALGSRAHDKADNDAAKIEVWREVERSGGLEATRFVCGGFMNYLGIGCPGPREKREEALAGFREVPYLFNVAEGWAEIPLKEDGSYPRLTMTEIGDIGRFVAAALDLERWETEMPMAGDVLGFGEVVKLAEKVTGRRFRVKEVTKEQFQKEIEGLAPEDWIRHMECTYSKIFCDDQIGETVLDPLLNRLCPQVKPITVAQYLEKYWGQSEAK